MNKARFGGLCRSPLQQPAFRRNQGAGCAEQDDDVARFKLGVLRGFQFADVLAPNGGDFDVLAAKREFLQRLADGVGAFIKGNRT